MSDFLTPSQRDEWKRMALAEADEDERSHADLVVGKLLAHADYMDAERAELQTEINELQEKYTSTIFELEELRFHYGLMKTRAEQAEERLAEISND